MLSFGSLVAPLILSEIPRHAPGLKSVYSTSKFQRKDLIYKRTAILFLFLFSGLRKDRYILLHTSAYLE